jgi:hypothetical protein
METLHSQEDVTGQIDKDGLPWDERIHSSNKKMTAKGVWVARRGVDEITRATVIQELRGGNVPPVPQPALSEQWAHLGSPVPQTIPPVQIPQYIPPAVPAPIPQSIPAPAAMGQYIPPAAPVAQPQSFSIQDLFGKISPMFTADIENAQIYVNSLTQRLSTQFQVQVQSINDIAGRPEMIAFAMQLMANDGK